MTSADASRGVRRNPYVGAQLTVAAAIALDVALPKRLTIGPIWLMPAVEGALLLALIGMAYHPALHDSPRRRHFALAMIGMVSAVNAVSLGLLTHYLLHGHDSNGRTLILAGTVLWLTNVLLFGLWFWELDRGGPIERRGGTANRPDWMFPQMSTPEIAPDGWDPSLLDYLYLSFTNATAFSPTDAMPLTPAAKLLMAAQSVISLVTVALVVSRAVNILS
jgi:hypothetical protein